MKVGGQRQAPAAFFPGKASGPVWTGAETIAPTGIRSPDRPAYKRVALPTKLFRSI